MLKLCRISLVLLLSLGFWGCASNESAEYIDFEQSYAFCSFDNGQDATIQGMKICPNNRECSDEELLPYQPCMQPMPKYYGDRNVSDGDIILIHPYTRTVVLCYENRPGATKKCVNKFKNDGYVLITDVPQLPAKYDALVEGNYPARRWGANRGQTVSRW